MRTMLIVIFSASFISNCSRHQGVNGGPGCSIDMIPTAISQNSYVVLESRGHGMFSILDDVVSLLYAYEKGKIAGLEINFGTTGLYYDNKHGPN